MIALLFTLGGCCKLFIHVGWLLQTKLKMKRSEQNCQPFWTMVKDVTHLVLSFGE